MKYLFKSFYALIFVCLSLSSCSENQKIKKMVIEYMKTEVGCERMRRINFVGNPFNGDQLTLVFQ